MQLSRVNRSVADRLHSAAIRLLRRLRREDEAMGLTAGIPVVGGAGDQAAGGVGNGIVQAGIISAQLGTSGVISPVSPKS